MCETAEGSVEGEAATTWVGVPPWIGDLACLAEVLVDSGVVVIAFVDVVVFV